MAEAGFREDQKETAMALFKYLVKKVENVELECPELKKENIQQLDFFEWSEDRVS